MTSGPHEVMVRITSLDWITVEVAALTEATAAAMMATVENCILDMSERLVVRMSDTEEKKKNQFYNRESSQYILLISKFPPDTIV